MADDDLLELVTLERRIVAYDAPSPAEPEPALAVRLGRLPVLVSAPHAACHLRAGAWKREDEYTAAFAQWLHEQAGAYALYPTHRIAPDPHDDADDGAYKQTLADLVRRHGIRLVLDLHGARGDRDFALALGTINGQTCLPYEAAIIDAFRAQGFVERGAPSSLDRLALNPSRYAGGTHRPTVTRFVWQVLGIAAVQIEINAWARIVQRLPDSYAAQRGISPDFRGEPGRIRRVLAALTSIIKAL